MKKEMKNYISSTFEAPMPQRKKEFLQIFNYPKTRWQDFIICQIGYIQKRVWIVSIMLFFVVMFFETGVKQGDIRLLWAVSSIIPFVALMTITELFSSAAFGMAELEMTTRYSLRSVLLARMGILGVGSLLLLLATLPILTVKLNMGIIKLGVYLLVPYLLTCFLSYIVVSRLRTREISYYCAGVAALISGLGLMLNSINSEIYQQQYFLLWLLVLALLIIAIYRSLGKYIKNMEEMTWNSYLIV